MAVVVAAALAGVHTRTFTVAADAADGGAGGMDSLATNHGLVATPTDWFVVDTTAAATSGNCWAVHSVGAAQFTVRKTVATAQNRTALVTIRDPHSIDR